MPKSNNAASYAPQADQRVDVSIETQEGTDRVAIRYSTWTEGLGWCGQKTIRLDAEQLEELHRALTVARQRLRRKRAEAGQPATPAAVIQLPTLASN